MKKENYLCLNGQKIELTKEQLDKIRESITPKSKLSEKEVGDIVTIGGYDFIVLEQNLNNTTSLLMKELLEDDVVFGNSADYKTSAVKKTLDEFAVELEKKVGENNVVKHCVDLTADDGLKDYGKMIAKVSILTCELYRKFVYIIDKYKLNQWWWLATSYSTKFHNCETLVKCVSPHGFIGNYGYVLTFGVRPFCILNSNIFVS
jgi:hypothetical protein